MNSLAMEILLMSALMFIITFGFGHLPSKIPASKKVMNLISIFGAGLLVGAALIVVVPEGMTVVFKSIKQQQELEKEKNNNSTTQQTNQQNEEQNLNIYIGVPLIFGFAVMLLIDQGFMVLQEQTIKNENENDQDIEEKQQLIAQQDTKPDQIEIISLNNKDQKEKQDLSALITTVGLVIHSVADGFALGSSVFLSQQNKDQANLGILIFLAILLHKAPASIGFGTYLNHQGYKGWTHAKYILAFTLSSPISASASYFLLFSFTNTQQQENEKLMFWVGIMLLISAGSFVYVALLHILPEVLQDSHIDQTENTKKEEVHYSKCIELTAMMIGLLIPLCLLFVSDAD